MFALTPERLAAMYACLREQPPFHRWKLPPADEVEFRTPARKDILGEGGRISAKNHQRLVTVSTLGHESFDHILKTLAHEMIHVAQVVHNERESHAASFKRRVLAVARSFGWDERVL